MKYVKLGELLVKSGAITQDALEQALAIQSRTGERLGEVLKTHRFVTEKQIIDALISQLGVDYIDLNMYDIPSDMASMIPKNIAKKHSVVPVKATRTELWLAMADPLNFMAIEEVQTASRRQVIPMIATAAAVERSVQNLYSNEGANRAIAEMQRELSGDQYGAAPVSVLSRVAVDEAEAETAPAIRLVNSIIDRAYTEGASDIHLEPGGVGMNVRMRIDGVLRNIISVPRELVNSVVSRIKIMSRLDISHKHMPQDGRADVTVRGDVLDMRVSTLPTIHGEKIVIRLLRKNEALTTLEGIGVQGSNREKIEKILADSSNGVILMVGPTGSGKTSTMSAMIDILKSPEVNLVSIEDPVEYNIDGICQVQVNEKTKLTFANVLRSVLRQDPDIIAVGEIRDGETAEIAMRAAMTGHLVLSTIHTNNAASSIDRLMDIGVEPYLIAGAIRAIISQRLVRRICPACKRAYKPDAEELRLMGLPEGGDYTFYTGTGCSECFNTGYRGRIAAFEILRATPPIRRAIRHGDQKELSAEIAKADFEPIMENCRELVLNGTTTVDEVYRAVGSE